MAVDLNAVMTALGVRLRTITGLRVADYPPDSANPPQAIVSFPEAVEYDATMGRGADRVVVPVTVLVGKVSERTARTALAAYLSGTGADSVKAAVEGPAGEATLGGAAQTVRVSEGRTQTVIIEAVEYLGATFDCEVYA